MDSKIIVLLVLLLTGCSSSNQTALNSIIQQNKEQMFVETNNQEKLIEFYKQELRENESEENRIKLAKSYLLSNDPESAIFVINQLETHQINKNDEALLILSKSYFQIGQLEQSGQYIEKALLLNQNNGEAHNIAGILAVAQQRFDAAEKHFIEARKRFYQDDVTKNNLAALYLLEGRYRDSYNLLLAVYQANPEDSKAKANLTVALIKIGDFHQAKALLKQDYDAEQVDEIVTSITNQKWNMSFNR
ncbi:tetratricopeptide repeat protein [Vibrio owensii]|uniref:tetratricopeptide repeat protein n=1 Tax=Vibrio owensii TaxID=696485 RepID=UPI00104B534C|nr:tetratricopeptide repeat protein [Vibrio owensii]TDE26250.1 tetratricopeptide repeat protein [Vibrio owensii]